MANPHSTGTDCPAKTLSDDDRYPMISPPAGFVSEPEWPPYGKPVSETAKRLARNIRLLRVSHGWSQEVLAELADLNHSFVGSIERAEHNVSLATVEKLATAFNRSIAELLAPDNSNR